VKKILLFLLLLTVAMGSGMTLMAQQKSGVGNADSVSWTLKNPGHGTRSIFHAGEASKVTIKVNKIDPANHCVTVHVTYKDHSTEDGEACPGNDFPATQKTDSNGNPIKIDKVDLSTNADNATGTAVIVP